MSFAARMGDMTAHGGTIVMGFPMVLIGGMPAARLTDMHVCPMVTPGVPPIPHVGGPISGPGSPTVLIGGMPAARVGDMAVCVGPPATILPPGCPTVMIGMAGAGSGSGGGAGGGGGAGAAKSSATAKAGKGAAINVAKIEVETPGEAKEPSWGVFSAVACAVGTMQGREQSTEEEEHWIRFKFVDSAGLPVNGIPYTFTGPDGGESNGITTSEGIISRSGMEAAGQATVVLKGVYDAKWSKEEAAMGEAVQLSAKVEGVDPGATAVFSVYQRDLSGSDKLVGQISSPVQGEKAEAEWELVYVSDQDEGDDVIIAKPQKYSAPEYYFEVFVGKLETRSGMLVYKDYAEIELKDADGNPMAGEAYIVYLSNGEVRQGKLDSNGYSKEENIPPAYVHVRFPGFGDVQKQ